jgi:hypothetical protein
MRQNRMTTLIEFDLVECKAILRSKRWKSTGSGLLCQDTSIFIFESLTSEGQIQAPNLDGKFLKTEDKCQVHWSIVSQNKEFVSILLPLALFMLSQNKIHSRVGGHISITYFT